MTRKASIFLTGFLLVPTIAYAENGENSDVDKASVMVEENEGVEIAATTTTIKSPDEWYQEGINNPSASGRVEIFVEAYNYYPEHEKIISGLNASVANLLNWTSRRHNSGDYDVAIDRYDYILTIEGINNIYSSEAAWKKEFAVNGMNYPTVEQLYREAMSERTASGRFLAFKGAYDYYPTDKKIAEGLHSSAELLFNWAIKQHNSREFEVAADRYERILSTDSLPSSFLSKVQSSLNEALQGNRPADFILEEAENAYSASGKFDLYIEGYESYPNNENFVQGINESGKQLLRWARGKHQSGNWTTAIDRYQKILDGPAITIELEDSAALHLKEANNRKTIPTPEVLLGAYKELTKVSAIFDQSVINYLYYPESDKFKAELYHASQQLLNWSYKRHEDGEFKIAKERYELILSTPYIKGDIVNRTTSLLLDAEIGKRSADAIYNNAVEEHRASYKLDLFEKGYEFYPEDKRFVQGLQDSARALLNLATRKHYAGDFDYALERYKRILEVSVLSDELLNEARQGFADAEIGKRPADVIYNLIQEESTASGLFELNKQGYKFYPEDKRFIQGLAKSSQYLYDLAVRYHSEKRFEDASSRYTELVSTDGVPIIWNKKAGYQLKYSLEGKVTPGVEDYILLVDKEPSASAKVDIAVEGYWIYDGNPKMETLVIESAYALLRWATNVHLKGDIINALEKYNRLLDLPVKSDDLVKEINIKKNYAEQGKSLPTADQLYNEAQEETRASYIFDIYVKANILYPADQRFINGIEESSVSLLNLAIRYHQRENYENAVERYDKLISTNGVPSHIQLESKLRKNYAVDFEQIATADYLFEVAENKQSISGKFDAYVKGYIFYPNDERFIRGLEISAYKLYERALTIHKNKDFNGAINLYEKLIATPGVPNYIVEGSIINLEYAIANAIPENQIYNFTEYNLSLEDALNIQMKVNPQTDKYIGDPAFVHGDFIRIIREAQISGTTVNVRTEPILKDKYIAHSLAGGTEIEIVDRVVGDSFSGSNLWYKIKYNDEILYAHTMLVDPAVGETTANVNLRQEPTVESHSFGLMDKGKRVTIIGSFDSWYKIPYDKYWKNAPSSDTEYYLDPTNFIDDENQKYQFLDLRYFTGIPASELSQLLDGKGKLDGMENVFREAAERAGINELYLISHALLETGHGTSTLSLGVEYKGKTVYNFFGIGAVDNDAINAGARRAYEEGWFTVEEAIIGGAQFAKQKYIYAGQPTLYSMRWNPGAMDNRGSATHQYATDIGWAYKQVFYYSRFYSKGDYNLIFDVPVYK
ncbi:N-acetylglucosaminidase [Ornithinibacillus halophilus]|uniref:Mannosyl-glycoprotein endo-beta-N-acetylglucosaminidase n=1 Tax=Ornithinibacillus halophilus TaxID=930117 RepID=A0A1M5EAA7_9BACI|nr:N-acetylglucosaminidase [Ornithinibacillus halophilus]SHF76001.1 mannosyl-glycoprotein endo-beta-N-acetylglucosaminidase [Ornithinibacillus halophilus]